MNEAPTTPLDREALRLLADIGFIGTQTGKLAAARAIFDSLRVLRPDAALPFIGLAMVHLSAEQAEVAAHILREDALKQHPTDLEVKAFLGLALHCAGRGSEAYKVLNEVVTLGGSSDEAHVRMAGRLLSMSNGSASREQVIPRWGNQVQLTP